MPNPLWLANARPGAEGGSRGGHSRHGGHSKGRGYSQVTGYRRERSSRMALSSILLSFSLSLYESYVLSVNSEHTSYIYGLPMICE